MAFSFGDRLRLWRIRHWSRIVHVLQAQYLENLSPRKSNAEAWAEMRALDSHRCALHRMYQDLFKRTSYFCRRCRGACCRGPYERFSPVDRLFKGLDPRQNASPLYRFAVRLRLPGLYRRAIKLLLPGDCKYLGPTGCLLPAEERPMCCVESVCRPLFALMDPAERRALGTLVKKSAAMRRRATALQARARLY